jgi:DNA recombination protein RmuC
MGSPEGRPLHVQESRTGEEGDRRRPDVILRMPGGKALVIDSKVSLAAYADAVAADTEGGARAPPAAPRAQRPGPRGRARERGTTRTSWTARWDWVLLFMPVEGAVSAAWAYDPELTPTPWSGAFGIAYPRRSRWRSGPSSTCGHRAAQQERRGIAERAAGSTTSSRASSRTSSRWAGRWRRRRGHDAPGAARQGAATSWGRSTSLKDLGARTASRWASTTMPRRTGVSRAAQSGLRRADRASRDPPGE